MGSCGRRFRRAFFINSTVFKRNRRISRTVLSFDGYRSVNELSVNSKRRRKQENICTQNSSSECAAYFLVGFFAVIERLTVSNLIEMANRSSI